MILTRQEAELLVEDITLALVGSTLLGDEDSEIEIDDDRAVSWTKYKAADVK